MKFFFVVGALLLVSAQVFAAKPCEELKAQISAKLDGKHVTRYSLDIMANGNVGTAKVVGSCDGGTKKIVYVKK